LTLAEEPDLRRKLDQQIGEVARWATEVVALRRWLQTFAPLCNCARTGSLVTAVNTRCPIHTDGTEFVKYVQGLERRVAQERSSNEQGGGDSSRCELRG